MVEASKLGAFVETATGSRSWAELRAAFVDAASQLIEATAWGVYRRHDSGGVIDVAVHGLPDWWLDRYEELGLGLDPVLREVVATHYPVHNLQILGPAAWHAEPLYRHVTARGGIDHILTAPIVGGGRIVGTLHWGRRAQDPPFGARDLSTAAATCLHVSALLASLDQQAVPLPLTPRELEIGRLAAKGLNNLEIAHCLSISRNTVKGTLKRVYYKLEVDSRAEMAARLARSGVA